MQGSASPHSAVVDSAWESKGENLAPQGKKTVKNHTKTSKNKNKALKHTLHVNIY